MGFTPGPWTIEVGNFIVTNHPGKPKPGMIVAEVPCYGANDDDLPLIAASPDLYRSLSDGVEIMDRIASYRGLSEADHVWLASAKELLAKVDK